MGTDSRGLELSTDDPAIIAGVDTFVESFISYGVTAGAILEAAKAAPEQVLVNAKAAALQLFMQTGDSVANAAPYLARAEANLSHALPREKLWYELVRAWSDDDIPAAIAIAEETVRLFPADIAAMKLGQVHQFHIGDHPAMLRLAETARSGCEGSPYFHGMLAFALEENNRLAEAEAAARHAIAMQRAEPWAHHAVAHVMEAQGRVREGASFMAEHSDTWAGCNSFMLTHNWWHLALFAIDSDDPGRALALFDQHVWGVWKEYSQDQVNAVSLLARLEFVGLDVGARWQDVAQYLAGRLHEHVEPFLDLHYLLGLVRAGREASATELLGSMAEHARARAGKPGGDTWREVALPLGRGILAYGDENWAEAFRQLGQGLPRCQEIGGSHAQRDLFHWLWLEAGYRAGALEAIRPDLQARVAARPDVLRHRRELARIS